MGDFLRCGLHHALSPFFDSLHYNDSVGYAELILNGDPETYLKTVTEYKPLD